MDAQKTENKSSCVKSVLEILLWKREKNKHTKELKEQALKIRGEGMSISTVSKIFGTFWKAVSCWLYREGKKLIEENEKNSYWVWTAVIEVEDGEKVVTFEVGKRDEETFLKVMEKNTFCWKILNKWVWGLQKEFSWK